jgi:hypothetical protein
MLHNRDKSIITSRAYAPAGESRIKRAADISNRRICQASYTFMCQISFPTGPTDPAIRVVPALQ